MLFIASTALSCHDILITEKKLDKIFENLLDTAYIPLVATPKKNEIIVLNTHYFLLFLNIPNLEIISKIRVSSQCKNNLIQLNSNEILISKGIELLIIDLNKYKTKLKIKNRSNCD